MNLRMGIARFDSAGKVARKDGVSYESCLDNKNSFRRGVMHNVMVIVIFYEFKNYGKNNGDYSDLQ